MCVNLYNEDAPTAFARALKFYRERQGLTQEEISGLAGVDRGYISGCESGTRNPSLDIISRLAQALQIDISTFFISLPGGINMHLSAPQVKNEYFRAVPLPEYLTIEDISKAMQETQMFFHIMRQKDAINLSEIIQGNNFSGIVSNVFTRKLSDVSHSLLFNNPRKAVKAHATLIKAPISIQ